MRRPTSDSSMCDSSVATSLTSVGIASLLALVISCSGGVKHADVIPTLPGDGTAHTAKPPPMPAEPDEPVDPWEDHDDLIKAPPTKRAQALTLPSIERFSLTNGLQVIVVKNDRLPIVNIQLAIKTGRDGSTRDKVGLAQFTAAMLTKGTRTRTALKLAETIDRVGGTLNANAGFEATLLQCSALVEHLRTCATLLADITVNPKFPKPEMELVRAQLIGAVASRKDDAGGMANAHVQNLLWGDEHVRGWPMSEKTLEAIKQKDLRKWHLKHFTPQNAIMIVAGAVDAKKIRTELNRGFRWWQKRPAPKRNKYTEPSAGGSRIRLVDKPGQTQAHIRIAQLGIAHTDPDFYDHVVFNYVLGGGGFSSRLMQVVRSEAGKTYSVNSILERNRERGTFVISTFTRSDSTLATLKLLLQEMAKMKEQGPTDAEVQSALSYLSGNYLTRFESATDVSNALLGAELHGLGVEYVRDFALSLAKVTRDSAAKAAAKTLDPQRLAIVVVGDASVIEPQLKQAGWNYERVSYQSPIASYERAPALAQIPDDPKATAAAQALIDKALAAKGGVKKLRAIKTMTVVATGQVNAQGRPLPATFTRRFSAPDKLRLDIDINVGGATANVVTALNKDQAWTQQPGQGPQLLPGQAVVEFRKVVWRDHELVLLYALDKGTKLHAHGKRIEDGETLDAIQITHPDGNTSVLVFLDPKSHLIRRLSYTDQGVDSVEIFGDYRKVDGINVAHRRVTKGLNTSHSVQVTKVSFNDPIKDSLYELPK